MTRNLGYIPDPAEHRVTPFSRARKLGVAQLPASVDLRPFAPPVLDQNECGSCVGHAVAAAVACALTRAGTPLGFVPSPRSVYQLARLIDAGDLFGVLTDEGSMPNQAMRSLTEWGVRPMLVPSPLGYNSDCDVSNVNASVVLSELEQDAQAIIIGQYEVTSTGAQQTEDICAALAQGFPVPLAVGGGADDFQLWTATRGPLDATAPLELDHYIWLLGYRTANGKRVFRARNNWGPDWGDGGEIEFTDGYVQFCSDIYPLSIRKAAA